MHGHIPETQLPPQGEATFPYHDAAGTVIYEGIRVVRAYGILGTLTTTVYRRPGEANEFDPATSDVRFYQFPELTKARDAGQSIFIAKDEPTAEIVRSNGVAATTCAGGMWPKEQESVFTGTEIYFVDDPLPGSLAVVAERLVYIAKQVSVYIAGKLVTLVPAKQAEPANPSAHPLTIARGYLARGWNPIPVSRQTKKPIGLDWQHRRLDITTAAAVFNRPDMNTGVQSGPLSNGLTDIDLDCREAVLIGPMLLPQSNNIFGRASKRRSHWLYSSTLAGRIAKACLQFKDIDQDGRPGAMLLELKIGGGGKGTQSVFPGSIHPSGETIAWDRDGALAAVDDDLLLRQVRRLAVAVLLARHWPDAGSRHDAALTVGGFLARAGLGEDEVVLMLEAITEAAGDDQPEDRMQAGRDAARNYASGSETRGLPKLIETFGKPVARKAADWLEYKDRRDLEPIVETNWNADELRVTFSSIPHRRWLYGMYLIRGEVTVMPAPGGTGKTASVVGMAVEIATAGGRLGEKVFGQNLTTIYFSGEESSNELRRRFWAFCLLHNIPEPEITRLLKAGTDDKRVQAMVFLQADDRGRTVLNAAGFLSLEAALQQLRPDLIVIDPLIAFCGDGSVNDNSAMAQVMKKLKALAISYDCAVLLVHHTRKGGQSGDAEAALGAVSIVNLARCAVMPVPMTEEDAKNVGILPSERNPYIKLVNAKPNFTPRSNESPWYELRNVELPNPEPPIYLYGDRVQAVERVKLPFTSRAMAASDEQTVKRALLDLIDRGKIVNEQAYPYSPSFAGKDNDRLLLNDAMEAVAPANSMSCPPSCLVWAGMDPHPAWPDGGGGWLMNKCAAHTADLRNLVGSYSY
jgi:RecA-family ATPase